MLWFHDNVQIMWVNCGREVWFQWNRICRSALFNSSTFSYRKKVLRVFNWRHMEKRWVCSFRVFANEISTTMRAIKRPTTGKWWPVRNTESVQTNRHRCHYLPRLPVVNFNLILLLVVLVKIYEGISGKWWLKILGMDFSEVWLESLWRGTLNGCKLYKSS